MSIGKPFALLSWVRITSSNNAIRAKINGVTATFAITAGTYWFGFGEESGASNDSDLWGGGTSLLQRLETDTGWHVALGFATHVNLAATANDGHVWIKPVLATDEIYWADALTTVDPAWFGSAGAATYSFASTDYEDVSAFSSALAFVGHRGIIDDALRYREIEKASKVDNKKRYFMHFETERLRTLRISGTGIPRETEDNTYHSLRRWLHHLSISMMGRRFYYFPDLVTGRGSAYNVDGATDATRYGREDLQVDGPVEVYPERRFGNSNLEWSVSIPVQEYVT